MRRRLILGLGNTALCDDGAGVHAARRAASLLAGDTVDVLEAATGGYGLIELLSGYERAVIIDAVRLPDIAPGTVEIFEPQAQCFKPTLHLVAGREVDLAGAQAIAGRMNLYFPALFVVGIQIRETCVVREGCSAEVAEALDGAARQAIRLLSKDPDRPIA